MTYTTLDATYVLYDAIPLYTSNNKSLMSYATSSTTLYVTCPIRHYVTIVINYTL